MTMPARRPGAGASAGPAGPKAADRSQVDPPQKSRKKLVVIFAAAVILLGAAYVLKSKLLVPHYRPGQPVPAGQALALGTFTVNTDNGQLVQAGIDLQLTKPASEKVVEQDEPELKNVAIDDLSSWSSQQLLNVVTRAKLQHQLLSSFQHVLGTVDGAAPQVTAVYFTSFVVQ